MGAWWVVGRTDSSPGFGVSRSPWRNAGDEENGR